MLMLTTHTAAETLNGMAFVTGRAPVLCPQHSNRNARKLSLNPKTHQTMHAIQPKEPLNYMPTQTAHRSKVR